MAMSRPFPLHAGPAAGFDEPFEMLAACHERVQRSLALLERLGAHLADHGCDAQARSAASDVLRYFDIAAPLHHEDEERHVLPRLRAQGQGDLAQRLAQEHQEMTLAWAAVRQALVAVQEGRLDPAALPAARAGWSQFGTLYQGHLAAEDTQAYPLTAPTLSAAETRSMGEEMARRRQVAVTPASSPKEDGQH